MNRPLKLKNCQNCDKSFLSNGNNVKLCKECRKLLFNVRKLNDYYNHYVNRNIKKQLYRETHRKLINEQAKEYRERTEIKNRRCIYEKIRRQNDISYKLTEVLRNRLNRAITKNYKFSSMIELLGCSIEFLKQYLEKQFTKGMSWSNYGKWHIDHIKPCCSFDLSKKLEQKICFNYKNLQPLWAEENLCKNGKIT
jgi:hypothetical protein